MAVVRVRSGDELGGTRPGAGPPLADIRGLFLEILDEDFAHVLRGANMLGTWKRHPATVTTRISSALVEPNCMFVGDAARLVCPGTVEGIGFSLLSGCIAAGLIERHFDVERGFWAQHVQRMGQLAATFVGER